MNETHLTADEIRQKITETFEQFKPQLNGYHEYARRITSLSEQYHKVKLQPLGEIEELTLVRTVNSLETPKTLDMALSKFPEGFKVKRIIFDRANSTYYLFA